MKKTVWYLLALILFLLCVETTLQLLVLTRVIPWTGRYPQLAMPYNLLPFFSEESVEFDTVNGFKWKPGVHESLKGCLGKTVFHSRFRVNQSGFVSNIKYNRTTVPGVKRYLVFGDSFTDGYYLNENWVNRCNRQLKKNHIPAELYSYALNGTGIISWSRQFHQLISDSMPFDGVILAVFGNDLSRDPFVMHEENINLYAGWIPAGKLESNCWKSLSPQKLILNTKELGYCKSVLSGNNYRFFESVLLYQLPMRLIQAAMQSSTLQKETEKLSNRFIRSEIPTKGISNAYFCEKYGQEKCDSLFSLLDRCRLLDKEILLAVVPEPSGIQWYKNKHIPAPLAELTYLSKTYQSSLYNGYEPYLLQSEAFTGSCFLQNDGHWNQKGSDLFANGITKLLIRLNNRP